MSKSIDLILGAVKAAGEAALRLHDENTTLKARLAEARDARDLAEGKLIAYERMAERIYTYCRELSDGENVRLTDYEPWEAWLELARAMAELKAAIADQPTDAALLAAAGYIKRDKRLQCDECGGMFTPQMLPIHNCAADNGDAAP